MQILKDFLKSLQRISVVFPEMGDTAPPPTQGTGRTQEMTQPWMQWGGAFWFGFVSFFTSRGTFPGGQSDFSFCFGVTVGKWSGLTPAMLKHHSWWGSDHIVGYRNRAPHWPHARQAPFPLFYLTGPWRVVSSVWTPVFYGLSVT